MAGKRFGRGAVWNNFKQALRIVVDNVIIEVEGDEGMMMASPVCNTSN